MSSGTAGKMHLECDATEPFRRQGSLRKVLPSLPSADSQLSMSAKMIDRPTIPNRINPKAYSQFQQEYCIISEYNMLRKQDLQGIYVIPSGRSSLLWFGVIFVRQGMYQGGIFRFTLLLPDAFPDGGLPKIVFQSKVFHPMISEETGEIDIKSGFHEWCRNVNHIWQLLQYVRRTFYKVESKTPLNEEASQLYQNDLSSFREKVKLCVKLSQDQVYDPPIDDDPHYISFDPFDDVLHGPIRDSLLQKKDSEEESSTAGMSWVQPGSLQPFSKPNS